jgi:hypothetical protein
MIVAVSSFVMPYWFVRPEAVLSSTGVYSQDPLVLQSPPLLTSSSYSGVGAVPGRGLRAQKSSEKDKRNKKQFLFLFLRSPPRLKARLLGRGYHGGQKNKRPTAGTAYAAPAILHC